MLHPPLGNSTSHIPLAEKLRPKTFKNFIGQSHLLEEGKPLRRLIENYSLRSIILWGPPGTGKTTLGRIISNTANKIFCEISAVNAGVSDLRKVINRSEAELKNYGKQSVLFIDEVHRFNKTQQDVLLPHVEKGTIQLIGSTTQNPSFEVIPALRSRCQIFRLTYLHFNEMISIIDQALISERGFGKFQIKISGSSKEKIALQANGDARFALNALESIINSLKEKANNTVVVPDSLVNELLGTGFISYDKIGDEHYNHASAFQKSMRGSDPDAAVYWLAKMISGGEDPRFIARRLIVTASEDVGNANPHALTVAVSAMEAAQHLGFPEARIPLCQAAIYIAASPKSNSAITAIDSALADIEKRGKSYPVPSHLKDSHYAEAKTYGFGAGYIYPHNNPEHCPSLPYLPKQLINTHYYMPGNNGEEAALIKKIKKVRLNRNE